MTAFDSILEQNTQAAALAVRIGSSVYSGGKITTGVMGSAFAPELNPTDLMFVSSQGATNTQVLAAAWGACGTATGETFTVGQSYLGSQMNDSYALPIPTAPQPHDPIRVMRDSRTGQRVIVRKQGAPQKRQGFLQGLTTGNGLVQKLYGTYSFVDDNGVTHQAPGKRDPVVNLPQLSANIDNITIKFDANGQMYADLFGAGAADGSGASSSIAGITAGHGIELIPPYAPTDGPSVTVETGGSVPAGSYTYMYVWLFGSIRSPQSPTVSCTTVAASPPSTPAYLQPHLVIPGKPDIVHATAVELYRKDASVGANGTLHTKFTYASPPAGGVLISDSSTGASAITSGAYTGMYQWTATSTAGGVQSGDEWEYSPLVYVKPGSPPIPYDPRDGSLTTLIINGAQDGSSVFRTSDGGAFNQITGDITFPTDNPLNHSGFRLVDTLAAQADPLDYIDTKDDAALGAGYTKTNTSINIKPARYLLAPFSSMSPVSGTTPPVYELSGLKFSSSDPTVSNDGVAVNTKYGTIIDKENQVDVLLAASGVLPPVQTGDQTARALAGYDTNVYNLSALSNTMGDSGTGLGVKIDGVTITQNNSGELQSTTSTARAGANYALNNNWTGWGSFGHVFGIPWDGFVNGSNVYLDPSNTDGLTIPIGGDGDYWIYANVRIDFNEPADVPYDVEYVLAVELWHAGTQTMYFEKEDVYFYDGNPSGWVDPCFDIGAFVPGTQAGDVIKTSLVLSAPGGSYVWGGWDGTPTGGMESWVSIVPIG